MKKILTILTLMIGSFSIPGFAQAQTSGIRGSVEDGAKGIEAASISLLRSKDSSLVKILVSDKAGKFEFDTPKPGNYLVMVTAIGFAKNYSPSFDINETSKGVDLKTIVLTAQSKDLKAVTVA